MKRLECLETEYNDVDVWRNKDGSIDFEVIGATHATWHPHRLLTGHAWDAITGAALLHPGGPESLLMLGLGGGTALRQIRRFLPDLRITSVEIDPGMIRLARTYMEIDTLDLEVVEGDAYGYLETGPRAFDIVVDDLYRSGDTDVRRPREVTEDLIHDHLRNLAPEGTLVMNFVTGAGHHNLHRRARKTFLNTFASVRAVRPPHSHNEVLAGTNAPGGLRGPRSLRRVHSLLEDDRDREIWKELRNLKLR